MTFCVLMHSRPAPDKGQVPVRFGTGQAPVLSFSVWGLAPGQSFCRIPFLFRRNIVLLQMI